MPVSLIGTGTFIYVTIFELILLFHSQWCIYLKLKIGGEAADIP